MPDPPLSCLLHMLSLRTKLSPREPYPKPELGPSEPYPEQRQGEDWREHENRVQAWEQVLQERHRKEEAYLEARGPLSLLQAVYCDSCKAKVSRSLVENSNHLFFTYHIF